MIKLNEVYKCAVCGNIVEVVNAAGGNLVCCGQPMKLQAENTVEASLEKHVPVITKIENGFRVTVGSVLHPMSPEHHIEWIELITDEKVYRKYLQPGDEPIADFCIGFEVITARAYCNLHGLWKS